MRNWPRRGKKMTVDRDAFDPTSAAGESQRGWTNRRESRLNFIYSHDSIGKLLKLVAFYGLKLLGVFALSGFLNRRSLRILCYHGFSIGSEYEFRPKLFMNPADFADRMA